MTPTLYPFRLEEAKMNLGNVVTRDGRIANYAGPSKNTIFYSHLFSTNSGTWDYSDEGKFLPAPSENDLFMTTPPQPAETNLVTPTESPDGPMLSREDTIPDLKKLLTQIEGNIKTCDANDYEEELNTLSWQRDAVSSAIAHLERPQCQCDMVKKYAHSALGGVFLGELEDAVHFCPWCGGTVEHLAKK